MIHIQPKLANYNVNRILLLRIYIILATFGDIPNGDDLEITLMTLKKFNPIIFRLLGPLSIIINKN